MAFVIKPFADLVADMVAYTIANSSQITDMTPGSVIRSFCEATGLCLEELYVSTYLGFQRYLSTLKSDIFEFVRKNGVKASTTVVFGRTGTSGDVTIPIGTRVKTASGLRFLTTEVAQITNGNTNSAATDVDADEVGIEYNVGAGTITILEDVVSGVETVTNASAATGGVNRESDFDYHQRFQAYIEGLGRTNLAGLEAGALSVEGITSVSIVEHFPPVGNKNATIYIDDGSSGGVTPTQEAAVQAVIDGDGTEENPGYRAAGVNVFVDAPSTVTINVTADVWLTATADEDQAELDIITALTQYINALGIGDDVIWSEMTSAVMGVFGVTDCDITVPASNTVISSVQVGRIGTVTVTFN